MNMKNPGSSSRRRESDKLKIGSKVIHVAKQPVIFQGMEWSYKTERRLVKLMAISGNWAMVRRPHCVPYVVALKELEPS